MSSSSSLSSLRALLDRSLSRFRSLEAVNSVARSIFQKEQSILEDMDAAVEAVPDPLKRAGKRHIFMD
jgi:hypothetical protein